MDNWQFYNLYEFISNTSSEFDIITITETSHKNDEFFKTNVYIEGYKEFFTTNVSIEGYKEFFTTNVSVEGYKEFFTTNVSIEG